MTCEDVVLISSGFMGTPEGGILYELGLVKTGVGGSWGWYGAFGVYGVDGVVDGVRFLDSARNDE